MSRITGSRLARPPRVLRVATTAAAMVVLVLATATALVSCTPATPLRPEDASPMAWLRRQHDLLGRALSAAPPHRVADPRRVLGRMIDVEGIAAAVVGAVTVELSRAERTEVTSLLSRVLARRYCALFRSIEGGTRYVAEHVASDRTAWVALRYQAADSGGVDLRYLLRVRGAAWRIFDIEMGRGAAGMVASIRRQFAAVPPDRALVRLRETASYDPWPRARECFLEDT